MKFSNLVTIGFHAILNWFNQQKRDMPWRNIDDPYFVWISEIMLQQTRVDVVIPYYLRWIDRFPTIEKLAAAEEEEVLELFAGLGYYSRAKNLHKGAKTCIESYQGKIPDNLRDLLKIPGIGSYTAGAILSFGFHKKAAAVDGNVLRVFSRLLGSTQPIDLQKTKNEIESLLEEILPDENAYILMEALIELGALVCKKRPDCLSCPVKDHCIAYKSNKVHLLPVKLKKEKIIKISYFVFVYEYAKKFYIEKKEKNSWNSGLYEFPSSLEELNHIEKVDQKILPSIKAKITHHEILLNPRLIKLKSPQQLEEKNFKTLEEIEILPLSSGHKKIYLKLKELGSK